MHSIYQCSLLLESTSTKSRHVIFNRVYYLYYSNLVNIVIHVCNTCILLWIIIMDLPHSHHMHTHTKHTHIQHTYKHTHTHTTYTYISFQYIFYLIFCYCCCCKNFIVLYNRDPSWDKFSIKAYFTLLYIHTYIFYCLS